MSSSIDLPKQMRALVLESTSKPPSVQLVPTPTPTLGSAVVKVLAAGVMTYAREVYDGTRKYPFPQPFIPGFGAIARVAAVGPDCTTLKPGDLVVVDIYVHSRDDPTVAFLAGVSEGFSAGSQQLMRNVWRDSTYAEYCRVPLECLTSLNEQRLLGSPEQGGLGYNVEDLVQAVIMLVAYGGFVDIGLKPGDTVIVAPATGGFSGAGVLVALGMGAKVIAMGRNKASLEKLKSLVPTPERLEIVPITGDMAHDRDELKKHGPIDAFLDLGPTGVHDSSHIKSCMLAVRHGGCISLMAGYREDVAIPYFHIMHNDIRMYGKWMYNREDVASFFKMVENGVMKVGESGGCKVVGKFSLEQFKEALDIAFDNAFVGEQAIIIP